MKKLFLFVSLSVLLMACSNRPSDEENARVLAEYSAMWAELELQSESLPEDSFNLVFDDFLEKTLVMLDENKGGELVYAVLPTLYYYFTTEQKAAIFQGFREDSLQVEPFDRFYAAFQAEQNTAIGCTYADFACLTPDSVALPLSSIVGQKDFLLIDFWASWCGPCRRSMPAWKELYAEYGARVDILGVSLDRDYSQWVDAIARLDLPWYHVSELSGKDCPSANLYGVMFIPSTVLIRRDGTIVARNAEPAEVRAFLEGEK